MIAGVANARIVLLAIPFLLLRSFLLITWPLMSNVWVYAITYYVRYVIRCVSNIRRRDMIGTDG